MALIDLVQEYGALGLERQEAFGQHVGDFRSWDCDLDAERLSLDGGRQFTVQILGTESSVSNTWLWAWANEQAEWSDHVRRASVALRELGRRRGVAELTEPILSLDTISGELLALLAVGSQDVRGYFPGRHENGVAYLLVEGQPELLSIVATPRIFLSITSEWPLMDHRAAFRAYCRGRGMRLLESGATLQAEDQDGSSVAASFGPDGRVVNVEMKAGPS